MNVRGKGLLMFARGFGESLMNLYALLRRNHLLAFCDWGPFGWVNSHWAFATNITLDELRVALKTDLSSFLFIQISKNNLQLLLLLI